MNKWSWEKSNGNATDQQTQMAYNVLINKHALIIDFHHLVWNDLVDFIEKIIKSKGKTWDNTILSKEATKMTDNEKVLTAKRFNALYTQLPYTTWSWRVDSTKEGYIGNRLFIGVEDNATPDKVYSYYFIELVNIANSLI